MSVSFIRDVLLPNIHSNASLTAVSLADDESSDDEELQLAIRLLLQQAEEHVDEREEHW